MVFVLLSPMQVMGLDDANFVEDTANAAILRLYTQIEWAKDVLDQNLREGKTDSFLDRVFESEINRAIVACQDAYDKMMYREALKVGFFELQSARDRYREMSACYDGMHRGLIRKFLEVQCILISPICPHFAEYIYGLLGHKSSILKASWPEVADIDHSLLRASSYLSGLAHDLRLKVSNAGGKKKQPATKYTSAIIYTASKYPDWQLAILNLLKDSYNSETKTFPDNKELLGSIKTIDIVKPHMKKVMPYVQFIKSEVNARGTSAMESTVPFSEEDVLKQNLEYITKSLELTSIEVKPSQEGDKKVQDTCVPLKPFPLFK